MKDWHLGIYLGRSGNLGDGLLGLVEGMIGLAQFSVVFSAAAGVGYGLKRAGKPSHEVWRSARNTFLAGSAAMLVFNQIINNDIYSPNSAALQDVAKESWPRPSI